MRITLVFAYGLLACSRTGLDVDDSLSFDGSADGTLADGLLFDGQDEALGDSASDVALDGPVVLLCNTGNCAGCCDATGHCHEGHDDAFCGGGAFSCKPCKAGFHCQTSGTPVCIAEFLDGGPTTQCNFSNCPTGCCGRLDGISQDIYCLQGDNAYACGVGGQACADCSENGVDCINQVCAGSVCGGGHCMNGCCLGSECLPGSDLHFCGGGAQKCIDCAGLGDTCQQQQCKPPLCNANTCGGCCVGDLCVVGTQDNACGKGGATCVDCATSKQSCASGACQ